jgi:hypothetical protein
VNASTYLFADDTKIYKEISCEDDVSGLQADLDQLQRDLTREESFTSQLQAELRLMQSKRIGRLFAIYCTDRKLIQQFFVV